MLTTTRLAPVVEPAPPPGPLRGYKASSQNLGALNSLDPTGGAASKTHLQSRALIAPNSP